MKRFLFLLVFVALAWSWALIVLTRAIAVGFPTLPAFGAAIFQAFLIASLGLRITHRMRYRVVKQYLRPVSSSTWDDVVVEGQAFNVRLVRRDC